jgi:hypothetical protein
LSDHPLIEHTRNLVCVDCAATTTDGHGGWRGLLTVGDEDAEDALEVAVFWPACAAREFGV